MERKTNLSPTIPFLLIVNLGPKLSRKTSIMETIKENIELLGSIPLKGQRKTRIRPRI